MNTNSATFDASQVINLFDELTSKERVKSFKMALRKAANILKKQAVANLRTVVKKVNSKNKWNGKTLQSGIKISVAKDGQSAKVHIMGDFRLKFFEMGTAERYDKTKGGKVLQKTRSTGLIQASNFFKNAKAASENDVFNSIEQDLVDAITKINAKHNK